MDELLAERVNRLLSGPTGLGTSAARVVDTLVAKPEAPPAPESGPVPVPGAGAAVPPAQDAVVPLPSRLPSPTRKGGHFSPGYAEREWGDGSFPPLYCPLTARVDDDLALEVNDRLVAWADEIGIYADQLDRFRDTGFGRLAVLAHPDTDDVDPLLFAAKMNAAWWACDDYYADESDLGATPTELPPRLAMVMSAMDPPPPAGKYTDRLEDAVRADPVLMALRSAAGHLRRLAGPSQVMRICNTTFQMYVSWTAYAAWRHLGELPPVWRYLAARQHDSFYTSMTLIDVVGGYQLDANLFYEPRVHRAVMQAGTASVIVNDLHSAEKEAADELPDCNVVLLIAEEEGCQLGEAVETAVEMHNHFVRGFEASQKELAAVPSPELQRFLLGVQGWMAGGFEWHGSSGRYK
ncbi:terpene synthase [Actinomadura sp. KC216]|uniref:family 2 encapsulin nanocompartment cargo protein terpene cyclase n=1 Tax=Actinomadura sp. KC216 TaxID=2530370 RepID=UPI001053D83E|nr:family 2 encapsulin nanocompartment cargo protein terpene cyclase [Actinomadura sp. KC216]TDB82308.1 terpene synthase [Actinomadura sp. KC216]